LPLPALPLSALLLRPAETAARGLLGALLVREDPEAGRRVGRVVEVEAYAGPEDLASHARFGRTKRNRAMFAAPGRAYVYGVYGMHTCLNVVAGPEGTAAAILIRAVEPVAGADAMRAARLAWAVSTRRADAADPEAARARLAGVADALLASGPANLAAALGITRADDGRDLLDPVAPLRLAAGYDVPDDQVAAGPRVGVAYAGDEWAGRRWRFWVAGNPAVSRPRRAR